MAVAEEAEVPDAVESIRQHMDQEAADEFIGRERHRLLTVGISIVFPVKADLAVVDGHQAVVGDGDAMGIAADIIENLSWPGEWPLGIDHPCDRRSPGKENGDVA